MEFPELTVEALRDAEFREGWRGYNPADVDEFIDRVSVGVQGLHDKIHELTVRSERAESRLGGENDETVKRTLVLAQRAADLVVSESKSVAERIVQDSQREAERIRVDAESANVIRQQAAEADLARLVNERRALADAEFQQVMATMRAETDNAHQAARIAAARSAELQSQIVGLRDRLRAALTDQMVRLDHLVETTNSVTTKISSPSLEISAFPDAAPLGPSAANRLPGSGLAEEPLGPVGAYGAVADGAELPVFAPGAGRHNAGPVSEDDSFMA